MAGLAQNAAKRFKTWQGKRKLWQFIVILGLEDALEEVGLMQELENARKEQEKLEGKKEETKVSKRMFRAG